MARGKVGRYDDGVLVEMLAGGRPYGEIAEALGLSEAYVGKVARGERRPRLLAAVRATRQAAIDEARRLGARWSRALLGRHIQVGLAGDDETARKCREFALEACCLGQGRR